MGGMAWTAGGALIAGALVLVLLGMTLWQILEPRNEARPGVLGFATQRGDRMFFSLVGAALLHFAWIGLAADAPLWGATILSLLLAGTLLRWA
jgi:predicted small integral membrane protein